MEIRENFNGRLVIPSHNTCEFYKGWPPSNILEMKSIITVSTALSENDYKNC